MIFACLIMILKELHQCQLVLLLSHSLEFLHRDAALLSAYEKCISQSL
jgi:hypothetical protein